MAMTKHRISSLLDKQGGKITDRYGSIEDWGAFSGDDNSRIKTYPVTLKVRTGGVLDHWLFGRLVMDFEGMVWHKPTLLLDWNHDPDVETGVILEHDFPGGDLVCKAKLISREPNDRVAKIIDYASEGVPYEVSMTWGATQSGKFIVEDVPSGKEVVVNDRQGAVKGPCSIIRVWGMYGSAICPHGVDSSTNCQFDSENQKGTIMPKDLKTFTDKFGSEKGVEYMLDAAIETLEDAEKSHRIFLDAKEKAEQKAALDKAIADSATLEAENKRLKEDAAKLEAETKAKAEAQAKVIADAKTLEEENKLLKQALPGINIKDSTTPPTNTGTPGKSTVYRDSMQQFIEKRVANK